MVSSTYFRSKEDFEARPSYMLLKMDILYDDTVCRVQRVEERTQLVRLLVCSMWQQKRRKQE
eukprot:scaffold255979_cov14-Tisochrysis_lutea.AAC.1